MAGLGLAAGLGAAAGAGTALFKIGEQFDDATDKIRVGTGKTGKSLERLKGDFKAVSKTVPADFDTVSTSVTELNRRLGLSGKPLRRLSAQMVELSRITGTDITENVQSITRLFGDWSIKTEGQSKTLDKLFRLSQSTGISVSELSRLMVQFGSPLRNLGIGFDQAAAMFARFEREGVNIQTTLPGLRFALKSFAKEGREPAKALQETFEKIKQLGRGSEATQLAFKVFGQRAGPDMAAAIIEGRFELDALVGSMRRGKETIRGAARDTEDFSEKWQRFKNRVLIGLEPLATKVFEGVGREAEQMFKIIEDPKLIEQRFGGTFASLSARLGLSKRDWEAFGRAVSNVWSGIRSVMERMLPALLQLLRGWAQAFGGVVKLATGILTLDFGRAWDGVKGIFSGAFTTILGALRAWSAPFRTAVAAIAGAIKAPFVAAWDGVKGATKTGLGVALTVLRAHIAPHKAVAGLLGKAIRGPVATALGAMRSTVGKVLGAVAGAFGAHAKRVLGVMATLGGGIATVAGAIRSVFSALAGVVRDVVRFITRAIDKLVGAIGRAKDKIGDLAPSLPNLPSIPSPGGLFQKGGVIVPGRGTGDKVPALLEPGEVVWNRKAVRTYFGSPKAADAVNQAVPRFQGGGIVGLGRQLQKQGFLVGEHPQFGGVAPVHVPNSHHYAGRAIDVNWPNTAEEPARLDALAARLRGMSGVIELLWRVAGHFNHLHVAMSGGGGRLGAIGGQLGQIPAINVQGRGMLATLAQGATNRMRDVANAYLASLGPVEGAETSAGGQFDKGALKALWTQAGGSPGMANVMAAIALAESGGNPSVQGPVTRFGHRASGLWQIHPPQPGWQDPLQNARMAVGKLSSQGLSAWEVYTNGAYRQYLQKGGIAGLLGKTLGVIHDNTDSRERSEALGKLMGRIKGVGLPKGRENELKRLTSEAETFESFATRAGRLTVEPTDEKGEPLLDAENRPIVNLGRVSGLTEAEWLTKQLDSLFALRNALIRAEGIVVAKRERISKLIEAARKRYDQWRDRIRELGERKQRLERRLATARKQLERERKRKRPNKTRVKALRGEIRSLQGEVKETDTRLGKADRVRDVLKDRILPGLSDKRSGLNTRRGELLESLSEIQGPGSPTDVLKRLPAVGVLGGKVFDVQVRLNELGEKPPIRDRSEKDTDDERAGLLEQLLRETQQRFAVSEKQFEVLRAAPFGGVFHQGGVVPGPRGAERMVLAQGGETITPEGDAGVPEVHLHFASGMEWLGKFVRAEVKNAKLGKRAPLPGRGGGL